MYVEKYEISFACLSYSVVKKLLIKYKRAITLDFCIQICSTPNVECNLVKQSKSKRNQ